MYFRLEDTKSHIIAKKKFIVKYSYTQYTRKISCLHLTHPK